MNIMNYLSQAQRNGQQIQFTSLDLDSSQRNHEKSICFTSLAQAPDSAAPGATPSVRAPGRSTPAAAGPRPAGAWRQRGRLTLENGEVTLRRYGPDMVD